MNTHIVLGHVVLFATLENKKREELSFLSLVPRAGVEPAQG